jgi:hypothetical protein
MGDLSDVDPVGEVIWRFLNAAEVTEILGGPDRVSGLLEAPFPHLRVIPGSTGEMSTMRGRMVHEVTLELYGPMDGSVGSAALFRMLAKVLRFANRIPDGAHPSGRAVLSRLNIQGGITRQPLTSGQLRYVATLNVTILPPQ